MNSGIANKTPDSEQGKECSNLKYKGNPSNQIKSGTCDLGPRPEQFKIISGDGTGTPSEEGSTNQYSSLHRVLQSQPQKTSSAVATERHLCAGLPCLFMSTKSHVFQKEPAQSTSFNHPSACYLPPTSQGCTSVKSTAVIFLNQQLSSFPLTDTPYSKSDLSPRQKQKEKHILAKINSHKHNSDWLKITQITFKQLQSDLQVRFKVGSLPSMN